MDAAHDEICGGCAPERSARQLPDGIARRTFLAQSAMLAAGALLASCAGGDSITSAGGTTISSTTIKVSDYPELASVGGIALVTYNRNPLAIVRTGDATYVALSRVCPHQGSIVGATQGIFYCPGHGAQFDLTTGAWIGGQPTSNMRSYATTYDAASGTLTIGG